jgi:hypothetical protein
MILEIVCYERLSYIEEISHLVKRSLFKQAIIRFLILLSFISLDINNSGEIDKKDFEIAIQVRSVIILNTLLSRINP